MGHDVADLAAARAGVAGNVHDGGVFSIDERYAKEVQVPNVVLVAVAPPGPSRYCKGSPIVADRSPVVKSHCPVACS